MWRWIWEPRWSCVCQETSPDKIFTTSCPTASPQPYPAVPWPLSTMEPWRTFVRVPGLTRLVYDGKAENRAEDVGLVSLGSQGQAIRAPLQTAFHIVPQEAARSVWSALCLCPLISRHLVLCPLIEKLFSFSTVRLAECLLQSRCLVIFVKWVFIN